MKAILIGYGEVGKGLQAAFKDHHDVCVHDPALQLSADAHSRYDVMLVAIPYSGRFIETVVGYSASFAPRVIVVFSTVPVGTCRKIGALHSPIEGRHDNMYKSIRTHRRWLGGHDKDGLAIQFFVGAGLRVLNVAEPDITEFLKLQSLANYAVNIEWARHCKKAADQLGFDYELLKSYNHDYNTLVMGNDQKDYVRYVLDPPDGKIGGHCVLPNIEVLQEQYPHPFIETAISINKEEK